jgi:hypothetical protein
VQVLTLKENKTRKISMDIGREEEWRKKREVI